MSSISNNNNYPLVDLSDIPACDTPLLFCSTSSSTSRMATSTATKKRISSIFSSASTYDSDDDPFDLKASARKSKAKPFRQSIVNTAKLIDIEEASAGLGSPDLGLTDWSRMKAEAHAIAGEIKSERNINLNDLLNKSPLNSSPLCMTSEASLLFPSSPGNSPRKALFLNEDPVKRVRHEPVAKENVQNVPEVYLDDQLEKAININRKPLSGVNSRPANGPSRRALIKPAMTPSKLAMTPSTNGRPELKPIASRDNQSVKARLDNIKALAGRQNLSMTPSKLQTPVKAKIPERPSSTQPRRSLLLSSAGPRTPLGNLQPKMKPPVHSNVRRSIMGSSSTPGPVIKPVMSTPGSIIKPVISTPRTSSLRRSMLPSSSSSSVSNPSNTKRPPIAPSSKTKFGLRGQTLPVKAFQR